MLGRTKAWVLAQPARRQATATTLLRMMMPVCCGRQGARENRVSVHDYKNVPGLLQEAHRHRHRPGTGSGPRQPASGRNPIDESKVDDEDAAGRRPVP